MEKTIIKSYSLKILFEGYTEGYTNKGFAASVQNSPSNIRLL
jgi:hypothetical protein